MKAKTKNIIISFVAFCLLLMVGSRQVQAQHGNVSFQIFYDQLSPYGEWVNDPEYGYIWLPQVSQDFQPYATNGYWVNTQYGNTWYSNYDWGWAPFHYGRWVYNDYYGWAWVPGYEWGPAWVSWRQGGGQYGWAPLGPGMSFSVNINIPLRNWVFVPQRYFFNNNIYRYYTPYSRYSNFYNRTTIINNVYVYNNHNYYSGPDRRSLEQATRSRVNIHEVRNSTRPGRSTINSNSLGIYRPNISTENNKNARPARVVSADKISTRPSRTTTGNNSVNSNDRVTRPTNNGTSSNRATRGTTSSSNDRPATRPSTTNPASTTRPSNNGTSNNRATRGTTPSSNDRPTSRPGTTSPTRTESKINTTPRPTAAPNTSTNPVRNQREVRSTRQNESSRAGETRTVTPSARNATTEQRQKPAVSTRSNPRPSVSRAPAEKNNNQRSSRTTRSQ